MRILIVEDDSYVSDLLKIGLESESYAVDSANDGETGSYLARTNDYDVVLLDNNLPKKSGLTICSEIREAGKVMPVILLSVIADVEQKISLLSAGADDYMTKPFSFAELTARIRAVLRRPLPLSDPELKIGDLILNCQTHEVKRGTKNYYLTRKEFSLLELLLKHKDEVVSRGMILEHVWDHDANPFSTTIETHIFNIRKKIERNRGKKMILSVPGRGYKITA